MSNGPPAIHVLHVDDEPGFAELTAEFLERHDERLAVTTATSAKQGLDIVDEGHIDCIVSDFDMPQLDGIQFLQAVRETRPDLPFILFTGKGSEEVASEAISKGATDYLQKQAGSDQYLVLANRIVNAAEQYIGRQQVDLQRQQYQELFEKAPVMYIVTRLEEGEPIVEFCNQQFADKLGYSRDEVLGRAAFEFYTDESERAAREGGMDRALNAEFFREERRLLTVDDDTNITEVQAAPRYDEDGDVIGILTLFFDVTAHREQQQELELYNTMVETVPDGVYALNTDHYYIAANDGLAELTGYPKEELVGSHVSKILDADDIQSVEANRRELRTGDEPEEAQVGLYGIQTADDEEIPCEVRFRTLPSDDEFQGTAGVIRDITERQEREETLKRQNERLAAFAGIVSHDLRNPLNVASGRLELAQTECDSEHLDEVERSLSRMETMIDDLLSLARSGEVDEDSMVDLGSIVRSCWANVPTGDAELTVTSNVTLRANRELLNQLLENLLRNAVDHGGDSVTVTVGGFDGETGFYVADDGSGIPASEREKVFDLGYSGTSDGTGLGLNIVKNVVDDHGWEISIEESASGGTRFEVTDVDVET